jgi:RNA polymerase sigma factor (sigma-70 family)
VSLDSDEALVARVAVGDADALDQLFRRHHTRVFALCTRLAFDRMNADDLVQETFLRVMRHARNFKGESRFTTWLYRIARNVCVDDNARGQRNADLVLPPAADDAQDDRVELLECALKQLSPDAREALVLSRWHDLPYGELAQVLGCSEGAARVRVHRAIRQLGEIIKRLDGCHD